MLNGAGFHDWFEVLEKCRRLTVDATPRPRLRCGNALLDLSCHRRHQALDRETGWVRQVKLHNIATIARIQQITPPAATKGAPESAGQRHGSAIRRPKLMSHQPDGRRKC